MDLLTGKTKGEALLTQPLHFIRGSIMLGFQSGFYCLLIGISTAIWGPFSHWNCQWCTYLINPNLPNVAHDRCKVYWLLYFLILGGEKWYKKFFYMPRLATKLLYDLGWIISPLWTSSPFTISQVWPKRSWQFCDPYFKTSISCGLQHALLEKVPKIAAK